MKRFIGSKKTLAAVAATTGVVLSSGIVAFAYFTSTGQGTGAATVGTNSAWEVTSDAATVADSLTPGGPTETIVYRVKNTSTGVQQLHQVAISVATSDGVSPNATAGVYSSKTDSSKPACTKNDFSVDDLASGATSTQVKDASFTPGETKIYSVMVKMVNRPDTETGDGLGNQDNCKNQDPPLFFAAS